MIIVDCHEPKSIRDLLQQRTETKVCSLTTGDYLIKNIAIERKTLGDFLNSLVQQRLFSQLTRLKTAFPVSFLIVEAFDLGVIQNSRVFYGSILTIMLEINVKIIFTQTQEQTAEVILLMAGFSRGNEVTLPLLERKPKEIPLFIQQCHLIAKIPHVGNMKAKVLLRHFHTPHALFSASLTELQAVAGIGRKTAENIKQVGMGIIEREKPEKKQE